MSSMTCPVSAKSGTDKQPHGLRGLGHGQTAAAVTTSIHYIADPAVGSEHGTGFQVQCRGATGASQFAQHIPDTSR